MRAMLTQSDANGRVVIPGPTAALRWKGRTLAGYATFAADYENGPQQVLAADGMVYPFASSKNVYVTNLPAFEAFWYVVATDEKEARWLRPVPAEVVTLEDAILTEGGAALETEGGTILETET